MEERWAWRRVGRRGSDARAVRYVRSERTEASAIAARAVTAAPDAILGRPAEWDCEGLPRPAAAGADPTKSCPDAARRERPLEPPAERCATSAQRASAASPEQPEPPVMRQKPAEAQAGPGWPGAERPRPASAVSPHLQTSPRARAASAVRPVRPDAVRRERPAGAAEDPESAPSPLGAQAAQTSPDEPAAWAADAPRSEPLAPPQPPAHVAPRA